MKPVVAVDTPHLVVVVEPDLTLSWWCRGRQGKEFHELLQLVEPARVPGLRADIQRARRKVMELHHQMYARERRRPYWEW